MIFALPQQNKFLPKDKSKMDLANVPDTSARKARLCRLVVVSFGLLCILQATLNISLRLGFCSSTTSDFEVIIKNLTEEQNKRLNILAHYIQQEWKYFSHSVYYISSIKKSWNDSREDCLQRNADLVIINSREEQTFMRQFKKRAWIGLTDTEKEGTWKWVDGTQPTISYWGTDEPNSDKGRDEDCGEIQFFERENCWNDTPCDTEKVWICEKNLTLVYPPSRPLSAGVGSSPPVTLNRISRTDWMSRPTAEAQLGTQMSSEEADLYTQQGWVYFRGSFYYFSSIKKSWNDSREDCLQRGADLVIISSREEQNLIRQFRGYTWIGMTDTEEEGTWKWVDGTLLDKRYWHTGEPNNYNGLEEDCGEIKLVEDENKWNDIECNTENFWICEKMVDL
ncbi:C-type lectin domain family 4 member F-like [Archocentrus centrarchus]|uniref:C-type lectin domain family 4 member F-like n=1 Tax=Archocentrus centrarchus TaxID=63155 RepID=UPI0011E9F546|nr:C-type lectin domain family 4 member F-like [Archocentrus centrarchus]